MNWKQWLGAAGAIGVVISVAGAGESEDGPPGPARVLEQLDANKDRKISRQEFEAADVFDLLDTNKDGLLSREDHAGHHRMPGHLLRLADADRDNSVTPAEWSQFLASVDPDNNGLVEKEAIEAIVQERFGKDGDGRGRKRGPGGDEDRPALPVEDLEAAFKDLDKNSDGTLSSDEMPSRRGPHGHHGPGKRHR